MIAKTPIWLDCDPGHDDAFAIILAAEHPTFELLGVSKPSLSAKILKSAAKKTQISTVHGNASIPNVTSNAISLLTSIGRTDIPVFSGSMKPFMRPAVHAPDIHGESGIDGTNLLPSPPEGVTVQPGNAVLAMYNAVMKTQQGTCVIVATGTLTNVALLFATFPETVAWIKEVSIMGGAFGERGDSQGNITKWAEFNIYCDPESAQSIFSNPLLSRRITLVPLDLTHTVLATSSILSSLLHPPNHPRSARPTHLRKMLHDLLTFFSKTYADVFNITLGPPLHDPLAVAALLTDEIKWDFEEVRVHVVCDGDEVGRTVKRSKEEKVDEVRGEELGAGGELVECVVKVSKGVDVEAFWKLLLGCVEKVDGRYTWEEVVVVV